MTYGLFWGCIVPNRYPGIEAAVRYLCGKNALSLDGSDIAEASCCPVPGIFYSTDKDTWLALATRNLCLAQDEKLEIMTICNGCHTSLSKATEYLGEPKNMGKVNRLLSMIGKKYTGIPTHMEGKRRIFEPVKVKHFVDVMYNDVGLERLKSKVVRPLEGLKVAVHYGCHYLRPTEKTTIEDPNNPHMLDDLVNVTGAESIDYDEKLACCGAGGGIRSHVIELANSLTMDKCTAMLGAGANCIVTPCPFCLLQFDNAQRFFATVEIPVLHIAELLALSMGIDTTALAFDMHKISVHSLLRKIRRRE